MTKPIPYSVLTVLTLAAAVFAAAPATQPAARVPHQRPADGQTLEIALHDLGNFEYSEDNDQAIPDDVRKLEGVKIRIPGQMLPLESAAKVTQFLLVNDMMSCCFGAAPKLQNVVMCKLPKDKFVPVTGERILVEGTLHVSVQKEDGYVTSIFQCDCSSIKMAPQ